MNAFDVALGEWFILSTRQTRRDHRLALTTLRGTLGLACAASAHAIRKLASAAKRSARCVSVVDVNWRPVFWSDPAAARETILEFVGSQADLVKLTDEEAEWLYGIPGADALRQPEQASGRRLAGPRHTCCSCAAGCGPPASGTNAPERRLETRAV